MYEYFIFSAVSRRASSQFKIFEYLVNVDNLDETGLHTCLIRLMEATSFRCANGIKILDNQLGPSLW